MWWRKMETFEPGDFFVKFIMFGECDKKIWVLDGNWTYELIQSDAQETGGKD